LEGARRQPLKLSFLRKEEPELGGSGSVDADVCAESGKSFFGRARGPCMCMLCISTSVSLCLYSPEGREYKCAKSPPPFGSELDEKGVVICRLGFNVGMGMADAPWRDESATRRLNAELLLRKFLSASCDSCLKLLEKKLALEAVIGVLGVLFAARLGGGVVLRSSTSADGAGKDEILLLKGVPSGSRFKGGSLIGCRFFLFCCIVGVLSASDPEPTVSPRLCRIDPVLFLGVSSLAGLSPSAEML